MIKTNFKVRKRNPIFWVNMAVMLVMTVLAYFNLQPEAIDTWPEVIDLVFKALSNPYLLFMLAYSFWMNYNDLTTPGVSDSELVLAKSHPTDEPVKELNFTAPITEISKDLKVSTGNAGFTVEGKATLSEEAKTYPAAGQTELLEPEMLIITESSEVPDEPVEIKDEEITEVEH